MKDFSENININIKLNNIFKNGFDIDLFNNELDINIDDNFLGGKFRFSGRDLFYLLCDIEKEFNITITEEDINNIEFNTMRNIITIINNKLQQNQKEVI